MFRIFIDLLREVIFVVSDLWIANHTSDLFIILLCLLLTRFQKKI